MSIDLLEVKIDNTFRYWNIDFGKKVDIQGVWKRKSDTLILSKSTSFSYLYGKIYFPSNDSIPFFELDKRDSTLVDLTIPNIRKRLKYHNPPKDLFFKVNRSAVDK